MTLVNITSLVFSILTILGQVFVLFLLVYFIVMRQKSSDKILKFVSDKAIIYSLIVSMLATLGSLWYSEVLGFEPCKLCWFQRIFMYSQALIFIVAILKKDKNVFYYSFILSVFGGAIALYHYLLQLGLVPGTSCGVVGYSVSCAKKFVLQFGYITIPMMTLTAFLMIILFGIISKFSKSSN